jgi:hypothetical protein
MYNQLFTIIKPVLILIVVHPILCFGFHCPLMKTSLPAKVAYPPTTVYHDVASSAQKPPPGPRQHIIHQTDAQRPRTKKEQETPEEKEKRLARDREYRKQYRLKKKIGLPNKKPATANKRKQKSRLHWSSKKILHDQAEDTRRRAFFRELKKMKTADN